MKKFIPVILIMLFSFKVYGKEILIPNSDYLISKTLSFSYIIGGATIKFFKGNKYKIEYGSEGWYWYNEGNYEFKDGKLFIHPTRCLDNEKGTVIDCNESMGEAVCSLHEIDNSLYFTQHLKVSSISKRSVFTQDPKGGQNFIEFDVQESKIKEGTKRIVENIPIIVMGSKPGITIDNVKIRKKPSINSASIKYQAGLFGEDTKEYDFVPKNTELIIIARTVEKEKIKEWNNFWYFIKVGANDGVWAYGEFIKIK